MTHESTNKACPLFSMQSSVSCSSSETLHDARIAELESEWHRNLASGVDFGRMLTELLHDPPPGSQKKNSYFPLSEAFSQRPDLGQCQAFADAANSILLHYYSEYPPTAHKPAISFLPTLEAILGDDDPGPQILVVLRDQWERTRRLMVSNSQGHVHQKLRGDCRFDPATELLPPWEIVVAVLEFGLDEVAAPYTPSPSPLVRPSPLEGTCDDLSRKRPRPTTEDLSLPRPPKIRRVGSPSCLTPSPETHEEHACLTDSSPRTSVDGYHPQSRMRPALEARLLGCFHQLFSGAIYRSWASGAIIEAHQMSLVSCDRDGLVHSSPVDMRSPEGLKLLRDWILTMGSRSMEQWGYTNIFGSTGNPVQETEFDVPMTDLHLSFGRLQYRQHGIFGRCTNVYDITIRTGDTDIDGVCKIAWPQSSRPNEHELLEKVHAVDPIHTPVVYCAWDVFMELPSKRLQPHCASASAVEQRTLRITVMTRYQPIDNLDGPDFLTAFIQIMQCNMLLYEARCVHHRDLSPGNMMYNRDETGQIIGVLTDFDLALSLDEPVQNKGTQDLHGTAPFMALDLQFGYETEHTLQHNFESAFYILVWVAMGYKGGKAPSGDPLRDWRDRSWEQIAMCKQLFTTKSTRYLATGDLVRPGYQCLLEPIEKLRTEVELQNIARGFWLRNMPEPPPFTPSQFFEHLGVK